MTFIEELLYQQPPVNTERLTAQQDAERADKNEESLRAWYRTAFGETCGRVLADEHLRGVLP